MHTGSLLSPRLAVALATASLAVAFAAPAVPAASAAGIGGFSVRPGSVNPANPATRAYFIRAVARGTSFTDHVVVSAGAQTVTLRVYAADGLTGATSGSVYSNRQDRLRRAGTWVRPAVKQVVIGPHQQRSVFFTVRVPRSAKPGDHLAGIAFEDAHPHTSGGRFSVTEIVRAVVGIEVRVPGTTHPQVRLRGMSLHALPGTQIPSVVVSLGDSGGSLCKPRLSVSLASTGRSLAVSRKLDTILPGDYIPYPLPWPRPLSAGVYAASARAIGCGRTVSMKQVVHLGGRLSGTTTNPSPRLATGPAHSGMPWWPLPLVAVGGVAAGVALSRRGHRSARRAVTGRSGG